MAAKKPTQEAILLEVKPSRHQLRTLEKERTKARKTLRKEAAFRRELYGSVFA